MKKRAPNLGPELFNYIIDTCVTSRDRAVRNACGDLVPNLVIVLLAIDVTAGMVQLALNSRALPGCEVPVRLSSCLMPCNTALFSFQFPGFVPGEFATADSLPDSLLLICFPMIDARVGHSQTS